MGDIVIAAGPGELATKLSVPNLPVRDSENIEAVQWGKLLVNFNNALNALSGLPIQQQLTDRNWRRLMADQMTDALAELKAAQIPVRSTTPLSAWMTLHILRLPTPLCSRVAERTAEASAPGETQPNLTPAQIRP